MSLTIIGLATFAQLLIKRGKQGRLTAQALQELKSTCIVNTKNTDVSGLPIKQEAKILGSAVEAIEHFIDEAISKAWKPSK